MEAGFTLGFKVVSVNANWMSERITVTPDICNGKPVIRGTRITVQTVLEFLAGGVAFEFPHPPGAAMSRRRAVPAAAITMEKQPWTKMTVLCLANTMSGRANKVES